MKRVIAVLAASASLASLAAGCGQENLKGAPNVKGLTLPTAERVLKQHGYTGDPKSSALFGILIPSHYTVCGESTPNGHLVPLNAEKTC
jgi:predicted small lipoprotein YifL